MQPFLSTDKGGFTLIEILTVLLIVGTLFSVLFANFSGAREQARNKAITTDLKEAQLALELYRSQFGRYPATASTASGCGQTSGSVNFASSASSGCTSFGGTDIIVGLTPDFLDALPTHRKSSNANCSIVYMVDGVNFSWFKLVAQNCFAGAASATEGVQTTDEFARCPSSCASCNGTTMNSTYTNSSAFYESYAVYSNGGQCQ